MMDIMMDKKYISQICQKKSNFRKDIVISKLLFSEQKPQADLNSLFAIYKPLLYLLNCVNIQLN